jgi:DNA-binding CsgD family transcriptional regulator
LAAALAIARADRLLATDTKSLAVTARSFGLSRREEGVLQLLARGSTDAEIGQILAISPRTVGQRLRSIYQKPAVSSRSGATRIAVEQSFI